MVRTRSGALRALVPNMHSAAEPDVSWDGRKILFAGKKTAAQPWQIYEIAANGTGLRQVVRTTFDCRSPIHQSKIFYLDDPEPVPQITFVAQGGLYSARMDGGGIRRLTFNPRRDAEPFLNEDGRILYASEQDHGTALYGINLDGTDVELFAGPEGRRVKRMPTRTSSRFVLFVESDNPSNAGGGNLAAVDLRRNLHSYREVTKPRDGLFAWPSALARGGVLVSRREPAGTFGIYIVDVPTGKARKLYDDPARHDLHSRELAARPMPDGRASVVEDHVSTGKLYCLNVFETSIPGGTRAARRIRILEGESASPLGEAPLESDGSFQLEVPANIPLRVQTLDASGRVMHTSAPFWVKSKENRGCIGCHEDRERTPENRFAEALDKPAVRIGVQESAKQILLRWKP